MNSDLLPATVPILIVDDRPENLLALEELLSNQGYRLVRAASGNEALRLTLKQDFALILLDVQMPEMDGFETAELMRANPKTRHIPIIFVTAGMKDLHFQFKGYDSGAVDYLAKPIEPLFLQSKTRVFAELYRQRNEIELHKNHLEELVHQRTAELEISNEQLQYWNKELKATEELLRGQIIEFVETHDQLLATEEMLRVQIEEYQEAQKQVKESNRNLQTLFDVSPLAIAVFSLPEGVIREANHTFCGNFGHTDEEVIGRNCVELGLCKNSDERKYFLHLIHEQQGVFGFSTEIKTFDGETRNVLLYGNSMNFRDEQCLLLVFLDVTEQKRMEDQIRQTQKMEVIGQLAGGVAHDFNNMLTAILGSAELIAHYAKDDSTLLQLLGNIQKAATRSADLTGQLLAFSRKGHKNMAQIRMDTAINEVISLLERTIDKKISLETRLAAKNCSVTGDQTLLQNALLNLGVNARDAMPEGGIITFATADVVLDDKFCRSSTFAITPGSYIEISVSDTGIGMTDEIVQRVFEPFFTTKGVGKGTGLGLAAVYGTITDHHGCINIYSQPGIGTVFKLYLPVSGSHAKEAASAESLIQGSGGVLLVDDEEIIRDVAQNLLEGLGYKVYLAEDGEQALEVYAREKENIVLVIMDILMPRMDGREALRRLVADAPEIRVLISSGFHQEGTRSELKKLGARGFLQKPYRRQELCNAVAEAIGGTFAYEC